MWCSLLAAALCAHALLLPADAFFVKTALLRDLGRRARPARSSTAGGCPFSGNAAIPDKQAVPESIRDMVQGIAFRGDSGVAPDVPPPWLDRAKFERGQAFSLKNFFSLAYAESLSLIINFLFPGELQPLIFTRRSSTVYDAYRRYYETVSRVKTWYESDPWTPNTTAYNNIRVVRGYHQDAARRMNQTDAATLRLNTTFGPHSDPPHIWSGATVERVCEDAREGACNGDFVDQLLKDRDVTRRVHLNQFDMSLTQFAFSGLIATFPERFGLHGNLERELDAFCHVWAALGYALGIEDRFNFNLGGLEATRRRTRDVLETLVRPRLRAVNRDWEHMTRVLFEGLTLYNPGVSYEASLKYMLDLVGVNAPRTYNSLTAQQRLVYSSIPVFMEGAMRVPSIRTWVNQETANNLRRGGRNYDSQAYKESIERRSYRYQFLPTPPRFQCA